MLNLKQKLKQEIPPFLQLGKSYKAKALSMMEFKHESGGMGVYAQRGGEKFMIRLRLLSGVLDLEQFKLVYEYAKKYQLDYLHFTTRQTIQLHDMDIVEICELMEDALDQDIYTRGGGGDYPRNVSLSPLSGVAIDEVFDVTPYAILVNEHFLENITEYKLPRKLKVSFSNSPEDTGGASINDLGFLAVEEQGKPYFKLYLCGGLGNNPRKAIEYDQLIRPEEVLYFVDGMIKFFMQEGNYENRAKARTRYIAMRMSEEELIVKYKECVNEVKRTKHLKEISAELVHGDSNVEANTIIDHTASDSIDGTYITGLIHQRQEGKYTVNIHPIGGLLAIRDCKELIEFLETKEEVELRLTMDESMYVRNLSKYDAEKLLEMTEHYNRQESVFHSVACIGVPTCQIGICHSQEVLSAIINAVKQDINVDKLPMIQISGCNNSCGRHQVAALGFAGRKAKINDKVVDAFEVFAGGKVGKNMTCLGQSYGVLAATRIPEFISELEKELVRTNMDYEQFIKHEKLKLLVDKYGNKL